MDDVRISASAVWAITAVVGGLATTVGVLFRALVAQYQDALQDARTGEERAWDFALRGTDLADRSVQLAERKR